MNQTPQHNLAELHESPVIIDEINHHAQLGLRVMKPEQNLEHGIIEVHDSQPSVANRVETVGEYKKQVWAIREIANQIREDASRRWHSPLMEALGLSLSFLRYPLDYPHRSASRIGGHYSSIQKRCRQ